MKIVQILAFFALVVFASARKHRRHRREDKEYINNINK